MGPVATSCEQCSGAPGVLPGAIAVAFFSPSASPAASKACDIWTTQSTRQALSNFPYTVTTCVPSIRKDQPAVSPASFVSLANRINAACETSRPYLMATPGSDRRHDARADCIADNECVVASRS